MRCVLWVGGGGGGGGALGSPEIGTNNSYNNLQS